MRKLLAVLLIVMLALAACDGGDTGSGGDTGDQGGVSTETAGQVEYDPVARDATAAVILGDGYAPDEAGNVIFNPTPLPNMTPYQMPPPGTLPAAATEDPDAGLVFDRITLERTGGPAGIPMTIVVNQDGSGTRDGEAFTATHEHIIAIDDILDAMNFFGIPNAFLGPGGDQDAYRYTITVDRAGLDRGINAKEGYMPAEIQQLIAAIIGLTTS